MAHPKRQHSKTRGRKRRSHDALILPKLSPCPHCKKPIKSHKVCPYCGHYKGQEVVKIEPKKKKEK